MKKPTYFLYRINPFRPLYHGTTGFHTVPTKQQKSLARRETFLLWLFIDRNTARLLAASNNCEYAAITEYPRLSRSAPDEPAPIALKRDPVRRSVHTSLEDLA